MVTWKDRGKDNPTKSPTEKKARNISYIKVY